MKKSREKDIILNAIHNAGIEITPEISNAVSEGLRQVRREKFEERAKKKESPSQRLAPAGLAGRYGGGEKYGSSSHCNSGKLGIRSMQYHPSDSSVSVVWG